MLELPAGTEKQRIEAVFGKGTGRNYTSGLVDIKTDTDLVSIRGFVSKPETAGKNAQQYFFVNGRYMRHPYFQKAVQTAYSGMLPGDYQPSFFIYFDIAPEAIDVNIHPTKTEIKFADEQTIFQILLASVREALGKFTLAPTIDFNRDGEIDMPVPTDDVRPATAPKVLFDPTYNPFKTRSTFVSAEKPAVSGWEKLFPTQPSEVAPCWEPQPQAEMPTLFDIDMATLTPWQYAGKYILLSIPQGVLLINQYRAHVCVLYSQYIHEWQSAKAPMQQLLFPEILDLTPDDMLLIAPVLDDLRTIGFDMEQFGKTSYSINGVPAQLGQQNALPILQHILQVVRETGANARDEWRHKIALSLASDTAIPYGKTLTMEEMRDLLTHLFALPAYQRTPDGKRVIALMTEEEISKRF